MDVELIKKYLNMFKIAIIILIAALLIAIFFLVKIIPSSATYFSNRAKFSESQKTLASKQVELESAKKSKDKQEKLNAQAIELKAFYKDSNGVGSSTAQIVAGELQEILDLIKFYGIKIYKQNIVNDPSDDIFYKEKKNVYSVCKVELEVFSTYMKFQSFLKDLYKHEHFLDINMIEINPYKKDKSILHVKLVLHLYAEKDPNAGASREVAPGKKSDDVNLDLDLID